MPIVLGISALNTTSNVGMRPIWLLLLIVAIVLILLGCSIALLTLRNQRKERLALITIENSESRTET